MKQLECMIAWTPVSWGDVRHETAGRIMVGPWPDRFGWSNRYAMTGGACYTHFHSMIEWQRIAMLFIEFNTIVVRDGLAPYDVHAAFLKIDEYRRTISPDIKGAQA